MFPPSEKEFYALLWYGPREFFSQLDATWLADLQEFLHAALPKIIVIVLGAWILARILKLVTGRMIRLAESRARGNLAQVRTLASVTRATGIGIIGFIAALEILPLLGFKLEPLLASAGVAGVALGLAAQTIVKDCLNGILILVEDQYNVGDVVKLGGVGGTVETMSLRKTQVRDGDGTLYIIPNSQITIVANVTRDFSIATINVSVDFSANPDEVMSLLKDVAMSVRNDPAYKDVFLADPTSSASTPLRDRRSSIRCSSRPRPTSSGRPCAKRSAASASPLPTTTCSPAIRCASTTPPRRMGPLPATCSNPQRRGRPIPPRRSQTRSTRSREKECPKGRAQGAGNRARYGERGKALPDCRRGWEVIHLSRHPQRSRGT